MGTASRIGFVYASMRKMYTQPTCLAVLFSDQMKFQCPQQEVCSCTCKDGFAGLSRSLSGILNEVLDECNDWSKSQTQYDSIGCY